MRLFSIFLAVCVFSVVNAEKLQPVKGFQYNRSFTKDISFINEDTSSLKLENFKGKKVLLNVWATWCVPCVKELPSLDIFAKNNPNVTVVALSLDKKGVPKIKKFYKKYGIKNLKIYSNPSYGILKILKIKSLPTTIIFNKKSKSIGVFSKELDFTNPVTVRFINAVK